MTEPRALRRRRRPSPEALPEDLVEWFAGRVQEVPWSALLAPGYGLLAKRWRAYVKAHPGAVPPADLATLAPDAVRKR